MRWRFLLRPAWLALGLAVLAFAVLSFTVLAPWQFDRDKQKDARRAAVRESLATPVRPLRAVLPAGAPVGPDRQWRRVELTGAYVPGAQVLVRLRSAHGGPAFEVVAPMRLSGGTTVLINRGWVRPGARGRAPDVSPVPDGTVSVQGHLRAAETDPQDRSAVRRDGTTQIYAIEPAVVSGLTGVGLQPGYVQLTAGQPGVLNPVALPDLGAGRSSFGYALQWLAFGAMAPLGFAYLAWREANGRTGAGPRREPASTPRDPAMPLSTAARNGDLRR